MAGGAKRCTHESRGYSAHGGQLSDSRIDCFLIFTTLVDQDACRPAVLFVAALYALRPLHEAATFTDETPLTPEQPGRRRRRLASPLVAALRAIAPDERQVAIGAALQAIEEEERRQELLARMQALPTDELAKLLQERALLHSRGGRNPLPQFTPDIFEQRPNLTKSHSDSCGCCPAVGPLAVVEFFP
jgi:hypothetical protein